MFFIGPLVGKMVPDGNMPNGSKIMREEWMPVRS